MFSVRLSDGPTHLEGRVEIYHERHWGTICNDNWDDLDAKVVCRQLGYKGGEAVNFLRYGPGIGPILLDQVRCCGTELRLDKCMEYMFWNVHDCSHNEDAGVHCVE